MCDGNVFKCDVKFFGALEKVSANPGGYLFSLSNQLSGVKLCNDSLKYFVANGWQDTLIIVETKVLCRVISKLCWKICEIEISKHKRTW